MSSRKNRQAPPGRSRTDQQTSARNSSYGDVTTKTDENAVPYSNFELVKASMIQSLMEPQFISNVHMGILSEEYNFDGIYDIVEKPYDYEENPDAKRKYDVQSSEMNKLAIKAEQQWAQVAARLYKHISQSELDKLQGCAGFTTPSGLEVPSWNRVSQNRLLMDPQFLMLHLERVMTIPIVWKANAAHVDPRYPGEILNFRQKRKGCPA
jgi:hypothetical protein